MNTFPARIILLVLLAGLLAVCSIPAPVAKADDEETKKKPTLDALIPEKTIAYMTVPDVPHFINEIKQTAFAKLIFDPEVQEAFKEGIAYLKHYIKPYTTEFEDKAEISITDLKTILAGEFSFAVIDLPLERGKAPGFAASIDFGSMAANVEKLLPKWLDVIEEQLQITDQDLKLEKKTVEETTVYSLSAGETTFLHFTFIDGTLYAATKETTLAGILTRLKGETPAGEEETRTLAASRKYRAAVRNVAGESQTMFFYLDVTTLLENLAALGPDVLEGIISEVRLDRYDIICFGSVSTGGRSVDRFFIRHNTSNESDELLKRMLKGFARPVKLTFANFLPKSTCVYVARNVSASLMYDTLMEGLGPMGSMITPMIDNIEEMVGVKFREELFPLLDGELSLAIALRPLEVIPDMVMAWQTPKPAELEAVVGRMLDGLAGLGYGRHDITPWGEFKIHSFVPQGPIALFSPACTVSGGQLIVAASAQALKRILSQKEENTLASNPDFKKAVAKKLENASAFTYIDLRPPIAYGYPWLPRLLKWANRNSMLPFRVKVSALPATETVLSYFEPISYSEAYDGADYRGEFRSNIGGVAGIMGAFVGVVAGSAYALFSMSAPPLETPIMSLQAIGQAQRLFHLRHRRYGKWEEIVEEGYLDPSLASGTRGKFKYTIIRADEDGWAVRAVPIQPERVGNWNYYMDDSCAIRRAKLPVTADEDSDLYEGP